MLYLVIHGLISSLLRHLGTYMRQGLDATGAYLRHYGACMVHIWVKPTDTKIEVLSIIFIKPDSRNMTVSGAMLDSRRS